MANQDPPPEGALEIPEDATVIKQVQYAWLWSSMPWLVILGVIYYLDLLSGDPFIGAIASVIILVPRYIAWRRTSYILTKNGLIYERGGITGSQKYRIPWTNLTSAQPKYGNFGRALGYQTVELVLQNGTVARLAYVPILQDVAGEIQGLIDDADPEPEADEDGDEPEGEAKPYDPEASQYDPDEDLKDKPSRD